MPLSNAEKQRRWRERNVIVLTREANDIAEQLIAMPDQDELPQISKKLRKVVSFIDDHLRHPERTQNQQLVALGRMRVDSLDGPLPKLAAIAAIDQPQPKGSWRIEPVTKDGQRWRSGVRLRSREEAVVYVESYARFDLPGYVTADILSSSDEGQLLDLPKPQG